MGYSKFNCFDFRPMLRKGKKNKHKNSKPFYLWTVGIIKLYSNYPVVWKNKIESKERENKIEIKQSFLNSVFCSKYMFRLKEMKYSLNYNSINFRGNWCKPRKLIYVSVYPRKTEICKRDSIEFMKVWIIIFF